MEYEYEWAHRTQNLSGLSYRFAVRADDERLGGLADAVLAGLRDPCDLAPVEHWYSLTASDAALGTVDVTCDDSELARASTPATRCRDGSCGTRTVPPRRRRVALICCSTPVGSRPAAPAC